MTSTLKNKQFRC